MRQRCCQLILGTDFDRGTRDPCRWRRTGNGTASPACRESPGPGTRESRPSGSLIPVNVSDGASGPRRGGCAPRRGAPGGGVGRTHKPRTDGDPPACKDKRMLFVSTCPARRGWTRGRTQREVLLNAGPARTGARLTDRRPVCAHRAGTHRRQARCATCAYRKTPIQATGSNGLNTHQPAASAWRV